MHLRTRLVRLSLAVAVLLTAGGCTRSDDPEPTAPATTSAPPATAPASPTATPTPTPKPTSASVTYDWLTGAAKRSGNRVWAVKIENTAAARPQVGLHQADIVVTEEVEASITRMIGIFHTRFPTRVGPVRSARNTDAELLPMFGRPGLLYSGANSKVQRNIRKASIVPTERSNRDNSRLAPHNVMVNLQRLNQQTTVGRAQSIGWTFARADARWKAAADPRVKVGGDTTSFRWSHGRYVVYWNGAKNVDGDSRTTVKTDNVVVLSVQNHPDDDSTSSISIVSETVGKGTVTIYRDRKKLTGTWSRSRVNGPMTFKDANGKDMGLKPGQTWLMLQG